MKVMVVGQENVGKSTLIKALVRKWDFVDRVAVNYKEENSSILSTDGIDIDTYQFDFKEKVIPDSLRNATRVKNNTSVAYNCSTP